MAIGGCIVDTYHESKRRRRNNRKGTMTMKLKIARLLSMMTITGAMMTVGCGKNSETQGVGERTGAALDKAAEKTAAAAQATAEKTKDVAGKAVEKTGEVLEKAGEAVENTGSNMQE